MRCQLSYRCKCKVQVRIITGKVYKRLEFFGSHDETSHATNRSNQLKYDQITIIHNSVMVAPKQSATQLRRNLMQAKGSTDQHTHMEPSQLRLIQRRVQTARQELTKQKLAVETVPEALSELTGWC